MQRVLWLLIFCSGAVHAQTCWDNANNKLNADAGVSTVSADKESLSSEVTKCLSNVLQDPATLNRAVDLLVSSDSGLAFLRDIQFKFKTFEATDNAGTKQAHLGFSYSYAKSIDTAPMKQHCGEACTEAFDLRFSTQGNVAFDSDVNPRNFLESHLNFAWFRSSGGVKQLSPAEQSAYRSLALKAAQLTAGHEAELEPLNEQMARLLASHLTDQLYLEFGGDVSFESDQTFSRKQTVYAARAALDYHGWSGLNAHSWQATPAAGRVNIIDYPFALLRRLTGYDSCDATDHSLGSCFAPLATSLPTISVAIGQVQPSSNDPRARLPGGNGNFTRLAFEVSFKTPVAKMRDQPIYVTANYRYYDELNASDAVKQAHLAAFNFLQATIGPQRGLFASYSTGRLPFDVKADQLYELGFHTSLN